MSGRQNGIGAEEPGPEPDHRHRRADEAETRRHRRLDDTPADGVNLSSRGLTISWRHVLAALATCVGVGAPSVFAGTLLAPKLPVEAPASSNKIDRILALTERLEKKLDSIEERQRAVELDVAALKARENGDHR